MKNFQNIICLLSITAILFLSACGSEPANTTTAAAETEEVKTKPNTATTNGTTIEKATKPEAQEIGKIDWVSIEEVEKLSQKEKRKVMIDLYTSWCGWCKKMDKSTFQNAEVADYVNENFYAVKFDAENKNILKFKGQDYAFVKAGRRGYNQLAHNFASGRMSYPTISFLDEELEVIQAFPGFKNPDQFDPLLHYINENHYNSKTFLQFAKTYKAEL